MARKLFLFLILALFSSLSTASVLVCEGDLQLRRSDTRATCTEAFKGVVPELELANAIDRIADIFAVFDAKLFAIGFASFLSLWAVGLAAGLCVSQIRKVR